MASLIDLARGASKGAYFTRGSGHTQYGTYTEDSVEYQILLDRLLRSGVPPGSGVAPRHRCRCRERYRHCLPGQLRWRRARGSAGSGDARSCGRLHARARISPSARRWSGFWPAHQQLFIVEQNRDAQLRALLTLETAVEKSKMHSLLHYNGLPISSSFIVAGVLAQLSPQSRQQQPRDSALGSRGSAWTFIAKPRLRVRTCRRMPWGSRAATTKGRSRRCAQGVDTTPSPPPSWRPAGDCRWSRRTS